MTTEQTEPRSVAELIGAWAEAMADIRWLADDLGDLGWHRSSVLPGWSVGDVVAHLVWIERVMLGRTDPPHQPDWAALPHATTPFGRATEVPVDLRRGRPRSDVLAEFDTTIADRHAALLAGPQDPGAAAIDPFGRPSTVEGVLRMRTFDTWVHTQDIRLAVDRPGGTGGSAARISAEQIAGALGFVWARRVGAPESATLQVDVHAPDWTLRRTVRRDAGGKGVPIEPLENPTVGLDLALDLFVQLGCGRTLPDRTLDQAATAVGRSGDLELAERTVQALAVTP